MELNKENLIEAGGKLWEKGNMSRVYLNVAACKHLFEKAGYKSEYSKMEEKSLKKAKTFYDVNSGELRSDVGTVRAMFNRRGCECSK